MLTWKLRAARRLGRRHGWAGSMPFGDPPPGQTYTEWVDWDAGSAGLMDALGETTETTAVNWERRGALVRAYCDAYEAAAHRRWYTFTRRRHETAH